ncbi:serine/threonine protein kinase [Endomicrobium sp. AH-315-J14]|nr:serine/threonine protein kinase [Endomicrobium sp. AH-315-J14]
MPPLPPPVESEQLPRQFGKYTLLRHLATGGMAKLYLALLRAVAGFEKLVVIKRILPELTRDQNFVEMLLNEARVAATLSHPNVVQTFDAGEVDGTYYIAMEYINGEDIRSIVRAMRRLKIVEFPIEHTLHIISSMAAGLAYAHEKVNIEGDSLDIVHRDVSPQNVLVTFSGDVKLVDFGIAKSEKKVVGEQTAAGQLKGKVPYMSPEQARGQNVDNRSDIFSLGIVLFELATGRRLFKAKSDYETLKLICERDYPLASQVKPGLPPGLDQIVTRALEKTVERRYQSAREMQTDIENLIRHHQIPTSTVRCAQWMKMLFAEKIASQKEVLQDVKKLADVIAAQHSDPGQELYSPHSTNMTGVPIVQPQTGTGITGYTDTATAQTQRSTRRIAVLGTMMATVAAAAVGFFVITARTAGDNAPAVPPPSAEIATRGSLTITSEPRGCDIWLNGELQKSTTPTTIEGLPIGRELKLKVTHEGYEAYRQTITLLEIKPEKALEVTMEKGSVTVVLDITPKPTVIKVDGKLWKGEGLTIEGLSADEEHKVLVVAPGHSPRLFTFTAKKGEEKILEAALAKAGAKPATSGGAALPAAPKGQGKINVAARGGYCNVFINGRGYGPTPVAGVVVNEGFASVSCRTADGKTLRSGAKITKGQTSRVSITIPK